MQFTPEKVKGKIRSLAKQKNADARTLMRIYMMERFLERISVSKYKDNFVSCRKDADGSCKRFA